MKFIKKYGAREKCLDSKQDVKIWLLFFLENYFKVRNYTCSSNIIGYLVCNGKHDTKIYNTYIC